MGLTSGGNGSGLRVPLSCAFAKSSAKNATTHNVTAACAKQMDRTGALAEAKKVERFLVLIQGATWTMSNSTDPRQITLQIVSMAAPMAAAPLS